MRGTLKKIKLNSENNSVPETDHISQDSFDFPEKLQWRPSKD
jgi:hypothetical protein